MWRQGGRERKRGKGRKIGGGVEVVRVRKGVGERDERGEIKKIVTLENKK